MWSPSKLQVVTLLVVLGSIHARNLFMDSPVTCGQHFAVADESVIIKPRGAVGIANPPAICTVRLESSYSGSAYKFEIVVEAATFRDCHMQLRIFDGLSAGGAWIRMLGCGTTSSTGQFYSKGQAITLQLSRTSTTYNFGNDFSLRITVYRDPSGPTDYTGTYKFPVGGIVGIVLGLIVIILLAILLAWCYKTGQIPGLNQDYPTTKSIASDNQSKSQFDGVGQDNGNFVSWHNTEKQSNMSDSRSNFDLDDSRVWDSLTNKSLSYKTNLKPLNTEPPGGRSVNQGRYNQKNTNMSTFGRVETNQLSSSPRAHPRGKPPLPGYSNNLNNKTYDNNNTDKGELGLRGSGRGRPKLGDQLTNEIQKKRSKSGMFENPDKEGYMYDYDQVKKLSGDDNADKEPKVKDFSSELKDAVRRNSMKRMKSANSDEKGGTDQSGGELDKVEFGDEKIPAFDSSQNEDSVFSSETALNKHTDGETTGPEAQSSPKPVKKKRKNSKSPKSKRKNKDAADASNSPDSKAKKKIEDEKDLPPELYAPIFSTEESKNPEYQPDLYQPGYQGSYPMPPYDPRNPMYGGYPPGAPGAGVYPPGVPGGYPGGYPPGMPYQQAGQAQWYVESTPNGQQKMAFAMTTHSQSSRDDDPGSPDFKSTPYNQGSAMAPAKPGMYSSMVPAGTVLDDPQVPPPGTSLVRYDDDPLTGIKTSQVIWTDSKPDPTDPPPGSNPQITRKTITRITARSTEDNLPDAPAPSLQDMSFRTAQQIQASGQEPAFMAPTGRAPSHHHYPHSAIQFATETPDRSNIAFYDPRHAPGPAVIHEAPRQNDAFKDRITVNYNENTAEI